MKWSDKCDGTKSRAHTNVLVPGMYYIDGSADGYKATLFLMFNDDQSISVSLGTFETLDAAKLACERDRQALTTAEEAGDIYIVDASQMGRAELQTLHILLHPKG